MHDATLRILFLATLSLSVILGPDAAHAQASRSADAEARGLFDAAMAAFDDGRFDDALGYFQRSHDLSHRPELLFNIASTYERLRHDREAVENYEAYLEALPNASNRAFVEGRLRILRPIVEAEAEGRTTPTETTVPTPRDVAENAESPDGEASSAAVAEAPPPRRTRRIVILSVASAVVAGAAVGLAVGLSGRESQHLVTGDVGPGGIVSALRGR